MSYFAVIDTNVIVSSFLTKYTDTATARVIDAVVDGKIIPLYNEDVLAEYKDVLCRPRFSFESGKAAENTLEQPNPK